MKLIDIPELCNFTHAQLLSFWRTSFGSLTLATGTDAATTTSANTLYVVDMSAWATADRNYTMPASPSVGDRVGILVQAGNASFELIIKGNTSQTINGGSSASEWSRLFITGEYVELLYVASNTWMVATDKRIAQQCLMRLSTSAAGETAATFTVPTAASGVWTADTDIGGMASASNSRIITRRAGKFDATGQAESGSGVGDMKYFNFALTKNGTSAWIVLGSIIAVQPNFMGLSWSNNAVPMAVDDYILYQYRSEEGSIGLLGAAEYRSSFSVSERF